MIISPTSIDNKNELLSENKEKTNNDDVQKLNDNKNLIFKDKNKKEEEKEISLSQKNKINQNKKNFSKIKDPIITMNSNEITIKNEKIGNRKNKKVKIKLFNQNQTIDNLCNTDRFSKGIEDNKYMTTATTPKKSFQNSFHNSYQNIFKQSHHSNLKTPNNTMSLLKDYNLNSNLYNRNKRLKSHDIRGYYTEKNSDLYLSTQNCEYDLMKKYSGKPSFIIKEIEEPSFMKGEKTDIHGHGLKTERERSMNNSLLREIYKKDLRNFYSNKNSIKNLKNNYTTLFLESKNKEGKDNDFKRNNILYNSSQKNMYFLRKRNKYQIQNITLNSYNSLSKAKSRKNTNNLNQTFYSSNSKLKKSNQSLNSTFCETQNNIYRYNLKNNTLFSDTKKKNESLAPILENEKFHYLKETICTKNKTVKKAKKFFEDYPTFRKVRTLIEKNEIKGKERFKALEKPKKILNKYNDSPIKKHENKKMNNLTVKKANNIENNNIINTKNINKKKKPTLKNRAVSMDTSISNLTTLSNTHLFNGRIEDYLITKELGKGSYAVVKLAKHKVTQEKFAIKIYTKESLLDPQKRNTVKNEINILKQLNHINIMKLYEVIDSSKYLYLVLEYIKGISMLDVIKNEKFHYIEEQRAIKLFVQIVKGISYCQSKNINHRDIKLENILVIKDDIIKIIDFGFSVKGSKDSYQKLFCGTPSYMPPEIVNKEKYIAQYSDVWSLGVLLYAMLYGRFPFKAKDDEKLFELINKADVHFPENIIVSENIKNLIKKILNVEPKLRPTPDEIINDILFGE